MSDDKLQDINEQKEIEFYSACVNAWFNTKLEYDKSILFFVIQRNRSSS